MTRAARASSSAYDIACEHLSAGDVERAAPMLGDYLAEHPGDVPATYALGVCRYRMRQLASADEAFRAVLSADPRNHTATYYLGLIREHEGLYEEALQFYQRAADLDPGFDKARQKVIALTREHGLPLPAATPASWTGGARSPAPPAPAGDTAARPGPRGYRLGYRLGRYFRGIAQGASAGLFLGLAGVLVLFGLVLDRAEAQRIDESIPFVLIGAMLVGAALGAVRAAHGLARGKRAGRPQVEPAPARRAKPKPRAKRTLLGTLGTAILWLAMLGAGIALGAAAGHEMAGDEGQLIGGITGFIVAHLVAISVMPRRR